MESTSDYQQWLESLKLLPEPEAAEALRKALLKGTRPGGLTLTRAGIYHYFEHVHHYYGCPEDEPCDHDMQIEPLCWEKMLLAPVQEIVDNEQYTMFSNLSFWITLSMTVGQFEAEIRERWLKKSVAQRKVVLRTAWPTISLHHRPDIDHCVLNACPHQRHSQGLGAYAFPHLNLEDLAKDNSFLILLNARGRHSLFKFGFLDYELAPLIQLRPALLEKTKFTMGLMNAEYGQIFEWENEEAASDAMNKGDMVHPLPGSHILSMHFLIYSFLVKCVKEILPEKSEIIDSPLKRIMGDANPERIVNESNDFAHHSTTTLNPGPADQAAANDWNPIGDADTETFSFQVPPLVCNEQDFTSLSAIVREACYEVPTLADLGRLEALVSACRDAAEDHIWMLREDPGYFRDSAIQHKEHRAELLLGDQCGKLHSYANDSKLWPRVLQSVTTNYYTDLLMWSELHRRIAHLDHLSVSYKDDLGFVTLWSPSCVTPASPLRTVVA
jgi:hypothetical protein